MNSTLPPRFREKAFRRYESTIAKVLERYPAPTELLSNSFGLSLCTIENRLRDAISSYETHKWPSKLINYETFMKHKANIRVGLRDDCVQVFYADATSATPPDLEGPVYRLGTQGIKKRVDAPVEYLEAVAFLASNSALQRPIHFRITADQVQDIESKFDCYPQLEPDGSYKLI